jgi:hypothetical protein
VKRDRLVEVLGAWAVPCAVLMVLIHDVMIVSYTLFFPLMKIKEQMSTNTSTRVSSSTIYPTFFPWPIYPYSKIKYKMKNIYSPMYFSTGPT